MEKRFTKGKWLVVWNSYNMPENDVILDSKDSYDKRRIASVRTNAAEKGANAILISKAPELFDAVVLLQHRLEMLIALTPTGDQRNLFTDENIKVLTLLNEIE